MHNKHKSCILYVYAQSVRFIIAFILPYFIYTGAWCSSLRNCNWSGRIIKILRRRVCSKVPVKFIKDILSMEACDVT